MRKIHEYLPFFVFFIVTLLFHIIIIPGKFADDLYFSKVLEEYNFIEWLVIRYNEWSSRTIIEAILVFLSSSNMIYWKILNSLVLLLLAYSISFLLQTNKKHNWYIVWALLFLFSYKLISGAGWIATTLNYLWPLTFGLVALFPIKKYFLKSKIRRWEYPIYILSLLFASNVEQMCMLLIIGYSVFFVYLLLIKEKRNSFYLVSLFISLLSLVYIIISPGNTVRSISETQTWFPYFEDFSVLTKLSLGISTTFSELIVNTNLFWFLNPRPEEISLKDEILRTVNNVPFILLCIVLPIFVQKLRKQMKYTLISSIPIISILIFNGIFKTVFIDNQNYSKIVERQVFETLRIGSSSFYLPIFVGVIILVVVLMSFYWIVHDTKQWFLLVIIFSSGLLSRIVIGLSPTVFASGERTSTFLYFSIIFCLLYLVKHYQESQEIQKRR